MPEPRGADPLVRSRPPGRLARRQAGEVDVVSEERVDPCGPGGPPYSIAVAMSGGVDSSTVAALLVREGHNVVGMTMQLWNQRRLPELSNEGATGRCCSLDDV